VHATVEAVLNFHAKPGAERLQGEAGQPILGRPARNMLGSLNLL